MQSYLMEDVVFKAGDSVAVKPGVRDHDFDADIGGWQGRVQGIEPGQDETLVVHWDSVTLRAMPDAMIDECIEQGLSWTTYYIEASNVQLAGPRDTVEDVARAIDRLESKHAWSWLGKEGRGIREVLAGVDPDDDLAMLRAWGQHLRKHLTFPFDAEIDEFQERGPLQAGDRVAVRGISLVDDSYGVIVRLRRRHRQYDLPLCELQALDQDSPNYQVIRDYRVWFANR